MPVQPPGQRSPRLQSLAKSDLKKANEHNEKNAAGAWVQAAARRRPVGLWVSLGRRAPWRPREIEQASTRVGLGGYALRHAAQNMTPDNCDRGETGPWPNPPAKGQRRRASDTRSTAPSSRIAARVGAATRRHH